MEHERERRLLEDRARALARPCTVRAASADDLEVVTFERSSETFGVESSWVEEVANPAEITVVPCTPPFVAGIINVRGRVVTVLDLRIRADSARVPGVPAVVILAGQGMEFGVLVDQIGPTRRLCRSELLPAPLTLSDFGRRVALGLTRDGTIVLDGSRLLSDPGLVVREHVRPLSRET